MVRVAALLAAGALALPAAALASAGPPPVTVRNSLAPVDTFFGDTVSARVTVAIDTRFVDPERVRIESDFRPYARVDEHVERRREGKLQLIAITDTLRCTTGPCLPRAQTRRFLFADTKVTWPARDGGASKTLFLSWPALQVVTRLDLVQLAKLDPSAQPPWRASLSSLPAASYRVDPDTAFWALVALAALLAASGAFLVVRFRPRRTPRPVAEPPPPAISPLERALAMVESARTRNHLPDQRRALELLARELSESGEPLLSATARELAWAPASPPGEATATLAASVRELIAGGGNGHVA